MPPFQVGTYLLLKGHRDDLSPETEDDRRAAGKPGSSPTNRAAREVGGLVAPAASNATDAPPASNSWSGRVELDPRFLSTVADRRAPPQDQSGQTVNAWTLTRSQEGYVKHTIGLLPKEAQAQFWTTSKAMFGGRFSPQQQTTIMRAMIARSNLLDLAGLRGIAGDDHRVYMKVGQKKVIDRLVDRLPNDALGKQVRDAYTQALRDGSIVFVK